MGFAVVLLVFVVLMRPVPALGASRAEPVPGSDQVGSVAAAGIADSANPVALGQSDGVIDVYWRSSTNWLSHEWYVPGAGWNGPQQLASGLVGDPSPVIWSNGEYDVLYESTDHNLYYNRFYGNAWSGPMFLGMGPLGGEPHAVSAQRDVVDVFWRGTDDGLWHAWSTSPGVWYGPEELAPAGSLGSEPIPVASGTGNGEMDVFWMGSHSDLEDVTYRGTTGWSSPTELPEGTLREVSSAVAYGSGNELVGWMGNDQNLWYATDTGGAVSGPSFAGGGQLLSTPRFASAEAGQVDAFWSGPDGYAWYEYGSPGGSWSTPKALPSGYIGSDPVPTASSPGVMDVFWRGGDGGLWHAWGSNSGGWAGPQELVSPSSCQAASCFGS